MILKSERLRLRPVTAADLSLLHAMWTDANVRRYLWDDEVIPVETVAAVIAQTEADWERHRFGLWVVEERATGEAVGFTGFRVSESDEPELLYGLLPAYWHRGFATEAAKAALQYVFSVCRVPAIGAATDVPNVESVRVMERIGLRFRRRAVLNGLETLFYGMTADAAQALH